MKWKCKDGRMIEIREMTTPHLQNTVAMLRRNGFQTESTFFSIMAYACSSDTPDGAAMAAEGEANDMKVCRELEYMENELKRRAHDAGRAVNTHA